jgi:hypothetical protein
MPMRRDTILVLAMTLQMALANGIAAANECEQPRWTAWTEFYQGGPGAPAYRRLAIASDPMIAVKDHGQLEVLAIGIDGNLWSAREREGYEAMPWMQWLNLGKPTSGAFAAPLGTFPTMAVASHAGYVEVFAIADGQVWNIGQTGWRRLELTRAETQRKPRRGSDSTPVAFEPAGIWAATTKSHGIVLFLVNRNNLNLMQAWPDMETGAGQLAPFAWPAERTIDNQLSITRDREGSVVVATVGSGKAFVRRQSTYYSGAPDHPPDGEIGYGPFEDWEALGSPPDGSALGSQTIALHPNADGRLELVVRSASEPTFAFWHTWQSDIGQSWSGAWHAFGSPNDTDGVAFSPNRGGCLALVALGSPNSQGTKRLTPLYQKIPSSVWNDWGPSSPAMSTPFKIVGKLVIGQKRTGYLDAFARDQAGHLLHARQIPAN